jgi:hypothetical protein
MMADQDAEIDAMQALFVALLPLDDDARSRVLEWAAKRFGLRMSSSGQRRGPESSGGSNENQVASEANFDHFAELLDAAHPTNDNQRALVGGYWFQIVKGGPTFTSGAANDELKNTGNRLPNITRSLDRLQALRPALVIQVGKSGNSRQARKTYKLTTAGIRTVERMISGAAGPTDDEDNEG